MINLINKLLKRFDLKVVSTNTRLPFDNGKYSNSDITCGYMFNIGDKVINTNNRSNRKGDKGVVRKISESRFLVIYDKGYSQEYHRKYKQRLRIC